MNRPEVEKHSGSIPSDEDLPIYFDLYFPREAEEPLPVIIFLHGFKGFKDWGAFPEVCSELSSAGFAVMAINFSLNGVGKSMTEFDELELFARQTLTQDLEDVGTVISALKSGAVRSEPELNTEAIGLLGHSRGGHTAVAASAEYRTVKCLVTWSAVADYNARWSEDMIRDWNNQGVTEIKNGRTGQIMPVRDIVYKDALENADRLMAVTRVREVDLSALFVHAKGDEAVPCSEAELLYRNCVSEQKELKIIPGSGHTFDVSHPFSKEHFPETFKEVLDKTREWFLQYLP